MCHTVYSNSGTMIVNIPACISMNFLYMIQNLHDEQHACYGLNNKILAIYGCGFLKC